MAKIHLQRPAKCKDCGSDLPVGTLVRYYGKDRIYGMECHPQKPKRTWIDRYYGNVDDNTTIFREVR